MLIDDDQDRAVELRFHLELAPSDEARRAIARERPGHDRSLAARADHAEGDQRRELPLLARPLFADLDAAVLGEERRVHGVHRDVEERPEKPGERGVHERPARQSRDVSGTFHLDGPWTHGLDLGQELP